MARSLEKVVAGQEILIEEEAEQQEVERERANQEEAEVMETNIEEETILNITNSPDISLDITEISVDDRSGNMSQNNEHKSQRFDKFIEPGIIMDRMMDLNTPISIDITGGLHHHHHVTIIPNSMMNTLGLE
ncbi:hypothetical protein G5I_13870 [Acromyrmex echinatior]|uniref:Uncharacterized protein n=1 Tax=Acromyrmex echinatior TaxID=103372 RepID=F4X665_ACREC|nr:hypothetical protein G5I_13870 [Acromyrmex echinatior]